MPKQFREDLGLGTGSPFVVLRLGDALILLPEQQRFEQLCQKMSVALTNAGLSPETFLATLPETRKRVFARKYGDVKPNKTPKRRRAGGQHQ